MSEKDEQGLRPSIEKLLKQEPKRFKMDAERSSLIERFQAYLSREDIGADTEMLVQIASRKIQDGSFTSYNARDFIISSFIELEVSSKITLNPTEKESQTMIWNEENDISARRSAGLQTGVGFIFFG
ncbi:hypothetical protein [Lactococcus termiticola]|nr:hypothetical protein [Lactococcus termiticola]